MIIIKGNKYGLFLLQVCALRTWYAKQQGVFLQWDTYGVFFHLRENFYFSIFFVLCLVIGRYGGVLPDGNRWYVSCMELHSVPRHSQLYLVS